MAKKGKRQKIDWDNIKVTLISADEKNPNPHNPCSYMTPEQRREEIVRISARIWNRYVFDTVTKSN